MKYILPLLLALAVTPVKASEDDCIAITIKREAKAHDLNDARAVYQVIHNRMRVRNKTACQVVKEPKQFSFVTPKTRWKATESELAYLRQVEAHNDVVTDRTTYFYNPKLVAAPPKWLKGRKFVKQIGNHRYYEGKRK